MQYQYYDPHPHVCQMKQYECCKHHHNCRLYHICKDMKGYAEASKCCKRDCPTCDYSGCTMSPEERQISPLYVKGVITTSSSADDLAIELEREKERQLHKITHQQNYILYNKLFGDYSERRRQQEHNRYHKDIEVARQYRREYYHAHYVKKEEVIPEDIMPECRMDCENCPYEDCILPYNWKAQARHNKWKQKNPDYFANYCKANAEKRREQGKIYYRENKEKITARQKKHRSKPEVKAQRAAYDVKYRKEHPDSEREKKRRYNERHANKVKEYKRAYNEKNAEKIKERRKAYYEAHKEEIKAKQRQRYATQKKKATQCN